jgi:chemotaxis signal transduction protein
MEERLLLFSAAGEGFAFRLRDVSEVLEPQRSCPVPGTPDHFLGVGNFHGVLTALVDLGLYLGLGPSSAGNLLVLDARLAQLALVVDAVRAIVPAEAVLSESPGEEPLSEALLETELGSFRLLCLEELLCGLERGLIGQQPQAATVPG